MTASSPDRQSHLISTILTPAVRLFLRTQVERAENLQIKIQGGDRQLLSGYIPEIFLAAQRVIYQGLHLSQMQVKGENIRINLGQVVRGKPLKLLEIIPVTAEMQLEEADLNASLGSDLMVAGIADLLVKLLAVHPALANRSLPSDPAALKLKPEQMVMAPDRLTLSATVMDAAGQAIPLIIRTGLTVAEGRKLCFEHPCQLNQLHDEEGQPLVELHGFAIDLGPEVNIQALTLDHGRLTCYGQIQIIP